LILIAAGAILAWAVVLSLVFWSSWAGPGHFRRRTVSDGGGRRVIEEDMG